MDGKKITILSTSRTKILLINCMFLRGKTCQSFINKKCECSIRIHINTFYRLYNLEK